MYKKTEPVSFSEESNQETSGACLFPLNLLLYSLEGEVFMTVSCCELHPGPSAPFFSAECHKRMRWG